MSFPEHLRQRHFVESEADVTPGKMKCEKEIKATVFLQPKCYALLDLKPGKELHKMKGVSEKQNPHLNFDKYKDAYLQSEIVKGTNISIRRNRNKTDMETLEQEKNALTPFDNKRVWIGSNQSEPYGLKSSVYDEKSIVKKIAKNVSFQTILARYNNQFSKDNPLESDLSSNEDVLGIHLDGFHSYLNDRLHRWSYLTYGKVWNIDHTTPLKAVTELKELKDICHYTNLIPMLVSENSSKNAGEFGTNRKKKTIA